MVTLQETHTEALAQSAWKHFWATTRRSMKRQRRSTKRAYLLLISERKPTAGGVDCLPPKEKVSFDDEDERPWSAALDLFAGETGDGQ